MIEYLDRLYANNSINDNNSSNDNNNSNNTLMCPFLTFLSHICSGLLPIIILVLVLL